MTFIGELARKFGLSPQTIRFYEEEGLISPGRFGRFRIFTARDELRVAMIVECRRMGLPISLIRQVLTQADLGDHGPEIAAICAGHLDELKAKRAELDAEIAATQSTLERLRAAQPIDG